MDILFAIKSTTAKGGGAERVLATVTSGLADRGHQITLLTYDPPTRNSFYSIHPSIKQIKLDIGIPGQYSTLRETLQRMIALRRTIVENNPDIVVGFLHSMFIPLGLALLGTSIPMIGSQHIGVEHFWKHPIQHLLLQLTPFLTKKTTIISEKLREGYNNHLRRHMVAIPNPVSIPEKNLPIEERPLSSRNKILSVGRLNLQKDHKTLIEAYALLANDFPDWDLRIVGDGDLRPQLEEQIKSLELQDRITIANTTANISEEYLGSQLFAMPSSYEGFGLVTAEALSYGLPAVGFADCPGTNELIKHKQNGILVQGPQRTVAFAEGLQHLMNSPELRVRLGNSGPESVTEFSQEKVCDKWEELLQKWTGV
jgi:glycosyltransferase involved in cell wall biosynthesis